MDQPQEEFVADQSVPSSDASLEDKDHGAEVQHSRSREHPLPGHHASEDEQPGAHSDDSR